MTWGAGQRAVAQSGAWGPSQHPARWGGLSAEMHGWRMPESMQHELQDCPPHAPQTARVHPECPQRWAQERARPSPAPSVARAPEPLRPVLTARTWAAPTLQGHPGA